jgi:SAM-dependent methyltransferase
MSSLVQPYSSQWYATFSDAIPAEQTEHELEFLARVIPRASFPRVADLCGGSGRHARGLARRGHRVTGIDGNPAAVARASAAWDAERAGAPGSLTFVTADASRFREAAPGPFDAVVCLWASFGFFDAAGNRGLLRAIRESLRPGGRFIVDLYHCDFFIDKEGERTHDRAGRRVVETKSIRNGRLTVTLDYDDGTRDRFHWELFTPQSLVDAAAEAGLAEVLACSAFDESQPPSAGVPRMQLVFSAPSIATSSAS